MPIRIISFSSLSALTPAPTPPCCLITERMRNRETKPAIKNVVPMTRELWQFFEFFPLHFCDPDEPEPVCLRLPPPVEEVLPTESPRPEPEPPVEDEPELPVLSHIKERKSATCQVSNNVLSGRDVIKNGMSTNDFSPKSTLPVT
uniref:Uncharacterized protein n=1 Tax=Glossina pallidipes TaxID=7398 RepID=A0A1A9ZU01_GLOPL